MVHSSLVASWNQFTRAIRCSSSYTHWQCREPSYVTRFKCSDSFSFLLSVFFLVSAVLVATPVFFFVRQGHL